MHMRTTYVVQVGPHNVYNIYDNCPGGAEDSTLDAWLQHTGERVSAWVG